LFGALAVEPTLTEGGNSYAFAFMNVSGLVGGGLTSFDPSTPPPAATVGTTPVNVLVVYLPVGGSGGNSSGAIIDAFDETIGSLVDDTFVSVTTDGSSDSGATTSGNVDGYVDTTASNETITAYTHITPTNANFDQWRILATTSPTPPGTALTVDKGVTVYAFAFYKNPTKVLKEHKDKEYIKEIEKHHLKEIEKSHYKEKEIIFDGPSKVFGKEKDGKELVENPVGSYGGDPAYFATEVQRLNAKIAQIETLLVAAIKGQAFIKEEDRPSVGQDIARNQRENE
jgi:hypothetical protein